MANYEPGLYKPERIQNIPQELLGGNVPTGNNEQLRTAYTIPERIQNIPQGLLGGNVPTGNNEQLRTAYTIKQVSIERVLNGWIVKVGCQIVVFESTSRMLSELGRYYANPEQVEKEYRKD